MCHLPGFAPCYAMLCKHVLAEQVPPALIASRLNVAAQLHGERGQLLATLGVMAVYVSTISGPAIDGWVRFSVLILECYTYRYEE